MEYLGRITISGVLVPSRGAYMIRAGSRAGLRRAICEASTRWGGQCEPVVPVYSKRKLEGWWQQVIELSDVDGLINVDVPEADAQRVAKQLGLSVVPVDQVDHWGDMKWTAHPAVVDSWAAESNPPVASRADAPLWELACAGATMPAHEQGLAEQGFAIRATSPMPDQLARAQLSGTSLIERTTRQFYEYACSNGPLSFPTIVWVTKPDGFVDCLHFWNTRALAPLSEPRGRVLLLPVGQTQYWLNFREHFAALLARPDEFDPDVILLSHSLSDEVLHSEASHLGLTASTVPMRSSRRFDAPTRSSPFTYVVDKDPRQFLAFGRKYGLQMQTESFRETPKTVVTLDSPIRFSGFGYSRLELRSPAFTGFPRRTQIAEMIVPNANWREEALEIRTHTSSHYRMELSIPSLDEVTHALLSARVASWTLSEKGKLATPLMRPEVLGLCRRTDSAAVIAALTTPRSKELERQLRALKSAGGGDDELLELAARWGGRAERRFRRAPDLPGVQALALVEQLCALGLGERGLGISCTTCGVPSFVALSDTQSQARCPGCASSTTYDSEGKRLAVYYRLSTFLDRASDQGTLPVLMTIATLQAQSENTHLLPGVNVTTHDGQIPEVDLYGLHNGQVVAGEVKTSAAEFTKAQIARDVALSTLLNADTHIMACQEQLPESAVNVAHLLCAKAGISLMVLSGPQLCG